MDKLADELDVVMNYTTTDEHVPEAERNEQENSREIQGYLPFPTLQCNTKNHDLPFGHGMHRAVEYISCQWWRIGVLQPTCYHDSGALDFTKHCQVPLGAYAQAINEPTKKIPMPHAPLIAFISGRSIMFKGHMN